MYFIYDLPGMVAGFFEAIATDGFVDRLMVDVVELKMSGRMQVK